MKRNKNLVFLMNLLLLITVSFSNCASRNNGDKNDIEDSAKSKVYFVDEISPASLIAIYESLGLEATGNVAVKIHTGEPGNPHFLKPELIKDLVQRLKGTLVETNTAYGGRRSSTIEHYKVAEEHGFTQIAPVLILDEIEDIVFPIENGKHLNENLVGGHFTDFDFHVVLSHFKGHQMGGFGGAIKNLAIGYASSHGKGLIHSAGRRRGNMWDTNQDAFLESMAEAAKTITSRTHGKILYINVMNHLSVDCDCNGNPTTPNMADIGILGSLDPVALDQACIDLIYSAPDSEHLIERIESRNGLHTLVYSEELKIGNREYEMILIK